MKILFIKDSIGFRVGDYVVWILWDTLCYSTIDSRYTAYDWDIIYGMWWYKYHEEYIRKPTEEELKLYYK